MTVGGKHVTFHDHPEDYPHPFITVVEMLDGSTISGFVERADRMGVLNIFLLDSYQDVDIVELATKWWASGPMCQFSIFTAINGFHVPLVASLSWADVKCTTGPILIPHFPQKISKRTIDK